MVRKRTTARQSEYQPNERAFESRLGLTPSVISGAANLRSLLRHQEKVREHAESRLMPAANSPHTQAVTSALRAFLRLEDERLRVAGRLGAGGHWTACARSFTLDLLVQYV